MQQSVALKIVDTSTVDLLGRVLSYQNAEFIERLKDKLNLTHERAEVLFLDVKRFLYLCSTRHGQWSPPPHIDTAWHEFVLYTKDYARFCDDMFGRFMHHVPRSYFGQNTKGRTWATMQVARGIFGELSENWNVPKNMEPKSADIGLSQVVDIDPCDSCGCQAACSSD